MKWSAIISLALKVVVWLIKNKLDDHQQRELGRDDAIKEMMELFSERKSIADQINEDSKHWTDDDAANRVRFRDDDENGSGSK